jgi:hypothetical protein
MLRRDEQRHAAVLLSSCGRVVGRDSVVEFVGAVGIMTAGVAPDLEVPVPRGDIAECGTESDPVIDLAFAPYASARVAAVARLRRMFS